MVTEKMVARQRGMSYRPDIDGLRTISICSVILFHVWPSGLSGGFIGIDVFFVISGFLITSVIDKELNAGNFSVGRFYTHRMKRILPAFYAMILGTSVAAYLLLLRDDYTKFLNAAVGATLFYSNVYFSHQNNYFSVGSNEIPLLHSWSLSVEEQYYVFWPFFLFMVFRFGRDIKYLRVVSISILFICSYAFSIYCSRHNIILGYYSIFSRAFELMTGSVLALILENRATRQNNTQPFLSAGISSIAGLLLIGFSSLYFTEKLPFPGSIALIPALGAVLIIVAGHISDRTPVIRLLSTKVFVAIGLISYPMYLWHWPLLAFWHYDHPGLAVPAIDGLGIILMTLIISVLSYFFIELPIRKQKSGFVTSLLKLQLVPLALVFVMSVIVSNAKYLPIRDRADSKLPAESFFLDNKYCYDRTAGDGPDCIFGDPAIKTPPQVLLIGDSHAAMFTPFWEILAEKYHFGFKSISAGACYPLMNARNTVPIDALQARDSTVNKELCSNHIRYLTENIDKYSLFIISANWEGYFFNTQITFDFGQELENTIDFLVQHHKKVIVMGDPPNFQNQAILAIERRSMIDPLPSSRDDLKFGDSEIYNNKVRHIIDINSDAYYFDIKDFIVTSVDGFPYSNGFLLYKDSEHLNQAGSRLLANKYLSADKSRQLQELLVSWHIPGE